MRILPFNSFGPVRPYAYPEPIIVAEEKSVLIVLSLVPDVHSGTKGWDCHDFR